MTSRLAAASLKRLVPYGRDADSLRAEPLGVEKAECRGFYGYILYFSSVAARSGRKERELLPY